MIECDRYPYSAGTFIKAVITMSAVRSVPQNIFSRKKKEYLLKDVRNSEFCMSYSGFIHAYIHI